MRIVIRFGLAAAVAGLLAGIAAAQSPSVDNGRKVYVNVGCWSCHGYLGQGAVTGPKLAPDPMPKETFAAFLRSSNRLMPPYPEEVLSDSDVEDMYAYLASLPQPADYRTIPLLNQ
jgi:ubiquinol-cytochrome c reductase cytochrome c subunit